MLIVKPDVSDLRTGSDDVRRGCGEADRLPRSVQLELELIVDAQSGERVDRRGKVEAGVREGRAVLRVEVDHELGGELAAPEPEEARGVELDDRRAWRADDQAGTQEDVELGLIVRVLEDRVKGAVEPEPLSTLELEVDVALNHQADRVGLDHEALDHRGLGRVVVGDRQVDGDIARGRVEAEHGHAVDIQADAGERVEELSGLEHEDAVELRSGVRPRLRAQVEVHHAFEVEGIADGVEVDHAADIELETAGGGVDAEARRAGDRNVAGDIGQCEQESAADRDREALERRCGYGGKRRRDPGVAAIDCGVVHVARAVGSRGSDALAEIPSGEQADRGRGGAGKHVALDVGLGPDDRPDASLGDVAVEVV